MPQPKTQTRWTQDTRTAFLLALRLTGGVKRAAAEIGRQPAVCYKARTRDPDFAAAWDAIVAGQRAARRDARFMPDAAGAPTTERDAANQRRRRDGLTMLKRRAFLRGLAETGTVAAACARAGVSDTAVYTLRKADPAFAAAWARAVATAGPVLEQVHWEDVLEGWDALVFAGADPAGPRRLAETLLRQLLVKHARVASLAEVAALLNECAQLAAAAGGLFLPSAQRAEANATLRWELAAIEKVARAGAAQSGAAPSREAATSISRPAASSRSGTGMQR